MSNFQYLFKVLIVGDTGVGKSSLMMRFTENKFLENYMCTVGMDIRASYVELLEGKMMLEVWDTTGDERLKSAMPSFYHGAHGVLLVYDITSSKSFENIGGWLKEIMRMCPDRPNILLVGNKCDDLVHRQVDPEKAFQYARRRGFHSDEASAKSGNNVYNLFRKLTFDLHDRYVNHGWFEDIRELPEEPINPADTDRQGGNDPNTCC
ncbi:GTP-binding protein YPTM2 [Drosophila sechellia]|uniref:GM11294 n=1 Tax=Drosophila sechellia TaxID=7238 RepID=B4IDS9_DROSE|nr:GTP-binding protein YPTM2 [Drosophila sechellia]EDW45737.1 GM11294 [Drosophila sechellia]